MFRDYTFESIIASRGKWVIRGKNQGINEVLLK